MRCKKECNKRVMRQSTPEVKKPFRTEGRRESDVQKSVGGRRKFVVSRFGC